MFSMWTMNPSLICCFACQQRKIKWLRFHWWSKIMFDQCTIQCPFQKPSLSKGWFNGFSRQTWTSLLISSRLSFILSLQRQSRPGAQANRQTAMSLGQYWRKDAESYIRLCRFCLCVCWSRGAQVQSSHLFSSVHPSKQDLFSEDVHVSVWFADLSLKSTCVVSYSVVSQLAVWGQIMV